MQWRCYRYIQKTFQKLLGNNSNESGKPLIYSFKSTVSTQLILVTLFQVHIFIRHYRKEWWLRESGLSLEDSN